MKPIQNIRLFLSSPGDVKPERAKVHAIAEQVNRMLGNSLGIILEVIDWKTHIVPDMGRPQEVINKQVGDYDIFVGILWKRFGTLTGKAESGTEEEFKIAYANWQKYGRPRILFYFSQVPYMPKDTSEGGQFLKVLEFKAKFWEQQTGLVMDYQSAEEFSDLLREHLVKVLQEWFEPKAGIPHHPLADFTGYLKYLRQETMHIDIRGLVTGEGKLHQFAIDELYIPLRTRSVVKEEGKMLKERLDDDVLLQEALKKQRLFIKGEPGSGKTTFLRLIAYTLCQGRLGESTKSRLTFSEPLPLPLFIRIGALSRYISQCTDRPGSACPTEKDSPQWLLHYLESLSEEFKWRLSKADFDRELEEGRCMILLDGLDEAPSREVRVHLSRLAGNLVKAYPKCQVVLTSRPAALADGLDAVPQNFQAVEIEPLNEKGVEDFLTRWCSILYAGAPDKSERYKNELKEALTYGQIKMMAKTPVMLTALAVVHWNENRLPEQRAALYESVLTWLFRSKEEKEGRVKADRCRKLLQKLALAMFMHPDGRQRQVGLRWAAERIQGEFKADGEHNEVEQAENFLYDEMVDSGVIVERELRLEFWHLSFQEYLAAYEIGGMSDDNQVKTLFHDQRLYQSEWREVVLLLGGVLYKQGDDKINNLINRIIKRGPKESTHITLPFLAKEVALLGGMVQDLSPYNFEPCNPRYKEITQSVMGIFDREVFRSIPVQVREEAADALGRVGDPRLDREKDLWVRILAGRFWMGAQSKNPNERNYEKEAYDNESPVQEVELSEYWIGKYPVTVCQYRRFIEEKGYEDEAYWKAGGFGKFKEPGQWEEQLEHPTRPVVYVSWYEAKAYVAWSGCRLPTEAEWERAARGSGEEYRKYPWGNEEPDKETMNYAESGISHPTPVGIFPEDCSPEGVIDMGGNVWEWCEDWYSDYPSGKVINPIGPSKGSGRVVRGGGWFVGARYCRSADRDDNAPDDRDDDIGFRVFLLRS
jgi:formylglycine-generating enzyme required for sulfatase activity